MVEIGEEIYIKREKIYGEEKIMYQKGEVIGIYSSYILVKFRCNNGSYYKEAFTEGEIKKEGELEENGYIY